MTRKTKHEIATEVDELTDDDTHDCDTVLVIGGDADRAGVMSQQEYEERYSDDERASHIECDCS